MKKTSLCDTNLSSVSQSFSPSGTSHFSNLTPGHISGENSNLGKKNTLTPMFIAALFTIGKTWKALKGPSTDNWFNIIYILYI